MSEKFSLRYFHASSQPAGEALTAPIDDSDDDDDDDDGDIDDDDGDNSGDHNDDDDYNAPSVNL
jgi:hypothetical protein